MRALIGLILLGALVWAVISVQSQPASAPLEAVRQHICPDPWEPADEGPMGDVLTCNNTVQLKNRAGTVLQITMPTATPTPRR